MSIQVLRVMENRPLGALYPLNNPVFYSEKSLDDKDDVEDEFHELTHQEDLHPALEKEENKRAKILSKYYEKHSVFKEEPPSKYDEEVQTGTPRCRNERGKSYPQVAFRTVREVLSALLSYLLRCCVWGLDFLINLCFNEGAHEVLMVTFTVLVEVFVVMVFAVSTVLATILVSVDDAYRKSHDVRFEGNVKPEHPKDDLSLTVYEIPNTRPLRVRRGSLSPRSSKSDFRAPGKSSRNKSPRGSPRDAENPDSKHQQDTCKSPTFGDSDYTHYQESKDFNRPSTYEEGVDAGSRKLTSHDYGSQDASKDHLGKLPTIQNDDTDVKGNENGVLQDSINSKFKESKTGEKGRHTRENPRNNRDVEKCKTDNSETLKLQDSDNHARPKERKIKDDSLIKENSANNWEKAARCESFSGQDFNDQTEVKDSNVDKSETSPNEKFGDYVDSNHSKKDKTDSLVSTSSANTSSSQVETESINTNQPSMSVNSTFKSERGNSDAGSVKSFVSTKKMFENSHKN